MLTPSARAPNSPRCVRPLVGVMPADRRPGLPGDAQDHECDREADDGIGDWCSERDDDRRSDHGQAHIGVCSSVVPIGDQGGAVQSLPRAQTDARCDEVAGVPDRARQREHCQMSWGYRVNEAPDRLVAGYTGADEDRRDDREAGPPLRQLGTQGERDPQRHGRERIAEVVDQIGEQGDAAAGEKDGKLSDGGEGQDGERERDGVDALPRALDAVVYQAMGVAVLAMVTPMAMVVV